MDPACVICYRISLSVPTTEGHKKGPEESSASPNMKVLDKMNKMQSIKLTLAVIQQSAISQVSGTCNNVIVDSVLNSIKELFW